MGKCGVNVSSKPSYQFEVNGDVNVTSGNNYHLDGVALPDFIKNNFYQLVPDNISVLLGSDNRIKHNENDITNCLDILNKIEPKIYIKTSIRDSSGNEYPKDHNFDVIPDNSIYESGFIAQDISNNVSELSFLVNGKEYDASGNPTPLKLNYIGFHAYEVGAIKELLKRVEYLEEEVARLKGN